MRAPDVARYPPRFLPQQTRRASGLDKLATMRGPGESYSDVILRLVEIEARQH
jgi:hypothetical protein